MIGKILQSFKEALYRGEVQCVTYTKHEKEIVREGIPAIQKVLLGKDMDKKRSLLFCLDWFMDPYYGQDISDIENELINLLQTLIITQNDIDVKEDAFQLLEDYAWGPFPILEAHFNDIEDELKSAAEYTINMHRIAKIEQLMESECLRIYKDLKKNFNAIPNKTWVLHDTKLTEDGSRSYNEDAIEMHWLIEDDIIHTPAPAYHPHKLSEMNDTGFFIEPEIRFNISLKEKKVLLVYYFGKHLTRCISYDLKCVDEEYSIENPQVIWTG